MCVANIYFRNYFTNVSSCHDCGCVIFNGTLYIQKVHESERTIRILNVTLVVDHLIMLPAVP